MDPLVKAHLRIAALEQELQDPTRLKTQMGSSFSAHYLRVIPLPGDRIKCAEMEEPMTVLQVNIYSTENEDTGKPEGLIGYILSGVWSRGFQHKCRPGTCLGTVRIQRRGRGDFEQSLLRTEFGGDD